MYYSLPAYKRDCLEVVDHLLHHKFKAAAEAILGLPDPIQQQIIGAALSVQYARGRHKCGFNMCLMKRRRLEAGLSTDEMAKKILDHYSMHSAKIFKQRRAQFVEDWIKTAKPNQGEIMAVKNGSWEPPGLPKRMIIPPLTGIDVAHYESNRPHREHLGAEFIAPFEAFHGELWEDLMKLVPGPTAKKEDAQAREQTTETSTKMKSAKATGNGKFAPSEAVPVSPVVSLEPTNISEAVTANVATA